ncbi:Ubiquitin-like superfamily protein [Klebsormidium nitens]|uniref:Ubiquitin-like superfamily protein n=1 Tax=Klebsormidium nitens TaxID=105231 RepID=A0A1Y1I8Y1_KLENI|nr:Ubiquitin-like superfamily protein [Klebsormidium nitens]|eukprot:GAQ87003.1 Ubiquitin-like superfamily protein [Klebsormidium nitens]
MAEAARSPDVLELKIKTLDAQEFAVHVNKNASVPDLKAKVAENGGCPVESQRLIYRGRVLKDDQTVSDYNIEDGHVLHLVARQPPPQNEEDDEGPPPLEELGQQDVTSHILGSIAIDGAEGIPNLDQILSSVFSTFGMAGGLPVPSAFGPLGQAVGAGATGDVETRTIEMHFDIPNAAFAGQGFQPARAVPVAAPSRTPGQGARGRGDTLSIMSNFMRHLERRMQAHIDVMRQHGSTAPGNLSPPQPRAATTATAGGATGASTSTAPSASNGAPDEGNAATPPVPAPAATVPAPAATGAQGGGRAPGGGRNAANASSRSALLAGLLGRTQTLLQQQGDPLLSIMHERLANEASIVDPGDRGSMQADLQIGGSLLQGLGALLLELGRATRSVNLNTEPGQAAVNAASPFYISNTGILQGLTNPPSAGVPLPQPPQVQIPNAVVFQVQGAPPAVPLQVPGTPAQVVFQLAPQQHGAPRAYAPGGIGVQMGDPQGGGQAVGPNGGVMMQLLPNGTLAPLQGGPPAGSVFVGSVPGNATTTTLQQAYQGAQAAQAQQQQAQSQQMQNLLGSLLGAFMPPHGGAAPPANGGPNAPLGTQSAAAASADGERRAGVNRTTEGGNGLSGSGQTAGPTGTSAQQGQSRQRVQPTGALPGGQPPAGVTIGGPVDGAALMNLIGPIMQQLSGAGMNLNFGPGVHAGPQSTGGPQQQQEGGSGQPGQQQQGHAQHSQFRFPAPAPPPGVPSGQPQQPPAVHSVTVTRNVSVPGGNVRTTTTTFAVPGPQLDSNPGGSNNTQSSTQGVQNVAGGTSQGQPASAAQNGAPEAAPAERGTGQQSDQGGNQANRGLSAAASPASGVGIEGRGEAAAANEGKKEESQEKKESAAVGSGAEPAPEASSGGGSAPMGLGGTGLQPLPPRSRRRPAPRTEQQGRDGLSALTQMLQGGPAAGPLAPPRGTPPALGDIMGSVMQAMGGQGGGGGGLGGVLGQLMNNPGADQMMRQVIGDDADGGAGDAPDLGNMMSRMMPMVAQMLGGGGGGGGGPRSAGVRQRQADREEGWQEALSEEERARWEATIAQDEAAQAGAGPQRPLSDAYLRGSPAKRQRTGLDGTAFLMQSAQNPGDVLESMARSVRSELAKEGEAAFKEGSNEGLVSGVSRDEDLAQAYVTTLVEDAVATAEDDRDFGDGSKYPKTKEAGSKEKS